MSWLTGRSPIIWILAAIAIAAYGLLASAYWLSLGTFVGIYALLALGLNLVLGSAGQISFAQAAFFGMGAYGYAIALVRFQWPVVTGYLVAIVLAAAAGLVVGYIALRFRGHYLAMATLAFGMIAHIFFQNLPITGGDQGIYDVPSPVFVTVDSPLSPDPLKYYFFVWLIVLVCIYLALNLVSSRTGRALRALRNDYLAASVSGVNISFYKIQVFVVSAGLAGLAGALFAGFSAYVGPGAFTIQRALDVLLIAVIGGLGHPVGSILGALMYTVIPEVFRQYDDIRIVVYGIALVAIVIFLPGGFAGLLAPLFRTAPKKRLPEAFPQPEPEAAPTHPAPGTAE